MNAPLNQAERVSLALRSLYQTYGYRAYKVSRFEAYDLYAQNRNFLDGSPILTFSDLNGQLMALKPDITLSIIKNTRDDHRLRKLWYTENVYRAPRNAYGFQEIVQTGLECIGPIDLYAMAEVVMLAARSLETISPAYVLNLSHMGILTGVLESAGIRGELGQQLLSDISEKNLHALRAHGEAGGLDGETADLLRRLCQMSGPAGEVLPRLLALPLPPAAAVAAEELASLRDVLSVFGDFNINLDLSVTNDTDYYNGVIFRGFVDGAASLVLAGGRYDHLLHRMGKTGGAIGFAVYVSELERLLAEKPAYDVDVLLVYDQGDDPGKVARAARDLAEAGRSVRVQLRGDTAVTYRVRLTPDGKEAAE